MSVPAPGEPRHGDGRWETIRYALDSNARTLRLCLIWFVAIASPVAATVITMLMRHVLLRDPHARGQATRARKRWQREQPQGSELSYTNIVTGGRHRSGLRRQDGQVEIRV